MVLFTTKKLYEEQATHSAKARLIDTLDAVTSFAGFAGRELEALKGLAITEIMEGYNLECLGVVADIETVITDVFRQCNQVLRNIDVTGFVLKNTSFDLSFPSTQSLDVYGTSGTVSASEAAASLLLQKYLEIQYGRLRDHAGDLVTTALFTGFMLEIRNELKSLVAETKPTNFESWSFCIAQALTYARQSTGDQASRFAFMFARAKSVFRVEELRSAYLINKMHASVVNTGGVVSSLDKLSWSTSCRPKRLLGHIAPAVIVQFDKYFEDKSASLEEAFTVAEFVQLNLQVMFIDRLQQEFGQDKLKSEESVVRDYIRRYRQGKSLLSGVVEHVIKQRMECRMDEHLLKKIPQGDQARSYQRQPKYRLVKLCTRAYYLSFLEVLAGNLIDMLDRFLDSVLAPEQNLTAGNVDAYADLFIRVNSDLLKSNADFEVQDSHVELDLDRLASAYLEGEELLNAADELKKEQEYKWYI